MEEFDSGIKAMEGVGTSTAGFVGMAQKGPVKGHPVLITSMADYQRRFGGYLSERAYGDKRFLPYAVEQFFNNGGSSCYVMRVCGEEKVTSTGEPEPGSPACAAAVLKAGSGKEAFLTLRAAAPGAWGNTVQIRFALQARNRVGVKAPLSGDSQGAAGYELESDCGLQEGDLVCLQQKGSDVSFGLVEKVKETTVSLKWLGTSAGSLQFAKEGENPEIPLPDVFLYLAEWVLSVQDDTASEQYEGVSFNPERSNFVENLLEKSRLICVKADPEKLEANALEGILKESGGLCTKIRLTGGSDGEIAAEETDSSLYIGRDGSPDVRTGLMAFQTLSDVSILAVPGITDRAVQLALVSHCERMGNRFAVLDMPRDAREVSQLQEYRENVDSGYAAMYHPWLQCYDSLAKRNACFPPSGAIAGIYARTDNARGVHKAPANEIVRGCTGLSVSYNETEQGKLNPKGINLIRALPGQGIRVWGARTCSGDGNWKYINVRRLFIFIEESIRVNTNWAVFEPNDEMLWSRVEGTIRVFLTTQWKNGALAGATAEEAFFVNIGKSTMTEDDILNGRLICVIGVAPVRPAEFVIFRITQKMENAQ